MHKFILLILCLFNINGMVITNDLFNLVNLEKSNKLIVENRKITIVKDSSDEFIKISEEKGEGIIWLPIKNFKKGSIEIEMRGKNVQQKSFIGIAFHAKNSFIYDAIYCRPFNFLAKDSVKRIHSIQYVSHPKYTWKFLRENRNAEFEKKIDTPPNPEDWFKMKLVILDKQIRAFINNSKTPSLEINKLSNSNNGKIGIFCGDGSGGDFKSIIINKS